MRHTSLLICLGLFAAHRRAIQATGGQQQRALGQHEQRAGPPQRHLAGGPELPVDVQR
jgi:hypothetical protein